MLLNLPHLYAKYNMKVTGVIHVGAHHGEEYPVYRQCGIPWVIFIEPIEENCAILRQKFEMMPVVQILQIGVGADRVSVPIYKSSNDLASSSVLKPKQHLEQHPDVTFDDAQQTIQLERLDILVTHTKYNFINMDIQGYELEALKGATALLPQTDYIMTEVNRQEVYEGCAQIEQIDDLLYGEGFVRMETNWAGGSWGDAFYIRKTLL